ncbi:hypothetical protein [Pseudonocardia sp. H11422]|nr:hypothetical protein [Pseudonocardia sp. H11422]
MYDALGFVLNNEGDPDRAFPLYSLLWGADVHNGRAGPVAELG